VATHSRVRLCSPKNGLLYCPLDESFGVIESRQTRRYRSLPSRPFDDSSVDAEVIRPSMQPRMKESDGLSRSLVDSRYVSAFAATAENAGDG